MRERSPSTFKVTRHHDATAHPAAAQVRTRDDGVRVACAGFRPTDGGIVGAEGPPAC
jgi:hypothetical protein